MVRPVANADRGTGSVNKNGLCKVRKKYSIPMQANPARYAD